MSDSGAQAATDRHVFRDTVDHHRPARVLYHAGFTPDLRRRVVEHIGTEDMAGHYGFFGYVSPLRNAASLADIENSPSRTSPPGTTRTTRERSPTSAPA